MKEILLTSSVLILAVIALRRALRGRMDPRLQYALWLLVALRLLIPGSLFPSPVSVTGAAEELRTVWEEQYPTSQRSEGPAPAAPFDTAGPILTLPAEGVTAQPMPPDLVITHTPIVEPSGVTVRQVNWLNLIWKCGMVLTAAALLGSNLHFYGTLRKKRRRLEPNELPVPCRAPAYLVGGLPSPCLFGLLRPAIYLNEAALEPVRLSHILVHEETHRRHGDHLLALLRGLCLAIYWFDPLVWWAAVLCRRDCEMACDHSALRRLGEDERIPYGQTLLGMIAPGRPLTGLLQTATTMTAGKRTMKERLELIIKRPRMLAITLIAVLLAVAAVVAVTFGGEQPKETPADEPPAASDLTEDEPVDPGLPTGEGRRKGTYTFLLIVPDPYTGCADTLLLTSYNMAGDDINCMSIPRDTIVGAWQDPKKLSDYYFAGGDQDCLRDHVRDLTGILPDYTITLQPKGVAELVDALGGVEFYVPSDMDYEDPAQNLSVHLEKGRQALSGADAMAMLRYRCAADGDLNRITLRHSLLRTLTAQCLAARKADLLSAVKAAAKYTAVYPGPVDFPGLTLGNLLWLAQEARAGKNTDVQFFTMPCTPGEYEGETYLFADRLGVADLADQYLNPYTRHITYEDLKLVCLTEGGYLTSTDRAQANTYYSRAEQLLFWFQDGASTEEWLPLVGELDWGSLDYFKEPGGFDPCAEIQSAIGTYITERGADMTFAEYHDILSATEGLDGAYAEGYSTLVWQLYETDPGIFAQVVTESLDADERDAVIGYLARELAAREGVTYDSALIAELTDHLTKLAHGGDATISLGIATVDQEANAQAILNAIQAGEPTEDWLSLLNYMDWGTIGAVGRRDGIEDPRRLVLNTLLEYINTYHVEITMANYLSILSATEGLDDIYADIFSYIAWRLYEYDLSLFAHVVLNELPTAQRDQVLDYFRVEMPTHAPGYSWSDIEVMSREETSSSLAEQAASLVTTDINGVRFSQVGQTTTFLPRNVYGVYNATYTSSDPAVASVDTPGIIACVSPGEATVTLHLECEWGQYDFTCAVTFQEDGGDEVVYSVTPIWEEQTAKYQ